MMYSGEKYVDTYRNPQNLPEIREMLKHINSDCCYRDWIIVLMAVFHESNGTDDGFEIADSWSSKGEKYCGRSPLQLKWNSFRLGINNPITIATLRKMVAHRGETD